MITEELTPKQIGFKRKGHGVLKAMIVADKEKGQEWYYSVLGLYGYEHAKDVPEKDMATVEKEWKDALVRLGKGEG